MLTPRYLFQDDFSQFYEYFLSQPHEKRSFSRGSLLWEPDEPFLRIHYIVSGISRTYVEHENGHRKIVSFHGGGTVFPGYHSQDFKIEKSIITQALSDMEVLEFTKADFCRMFENNKLLNARLVEWFSMYVNLLLYETAHQEYNSSFIKLCNLLYLLLTNAGGSQSSIIDITQEDISDILGISRVNLTRSLARLREEHIILTHRKRITVTDPSALARYCSLETL